MKEILDVHDMLAFQGKFTTLEATRNCILREPPEIAFIRIGKAELNAYILAGEIKKRNPFTSVIFLSHQIAYEREAFECAVDGFLLVPFNEEKIEHILLSCIKNRSDM